MPPDPALPAGAEAHYRALESLYAVAPINRLFDSTLEITGDVTYYEVMMNRD